MTPVLSECVLAVSTLGSWVSQFSNPVLLSDTAAVTTRDESTVQCRAGYIDVMEAGLIQCVNLSMYRTVTVWSAICVVNVAADVFAVRSTRGRAVVTGGEYAVILHDDATDVSPVTCRACRDQAGKITEIIVPAFTLRRVAALPTEPIVVKVLGLP